MASERRTIYAGVTNNLQTRVWQHKQSEIPGFTKKYGLNRLVYFERYEDVRQAIFREKEIKGWKRFKKVALIDSMNPEWKDLAAHWY